MRLRFRDFMEDGAEGVAANHMGTSSSVAGTGGVDTFDPLLRDRDKLRAMLLKRAMASARATSGRKHGVGKDHT